MRAVGATALVGPYPCRPPNRQSTNHIPSSIPRAAGDLPSNLQPTPGVSRALLVRACVAVGLRLVRVAELRFPLLDTELCQAAHYASLEMPGPVCSSIWELRNNVTFPSQGLRRVGITWIGVRLPMPDHRSGQLIFTSSVRSHDRAGVFVVLVGHPGRTTGRCSLTLHGPQRCCDPPVSGSQTVLSILSDLSNSSRGEFQWLSKPRFLRIANTSV
jgi:hypothetical protein